MKPGELAGATVVFDLDGTLVDTAPDLLRALNQTLDLEGLPRAPASQLRHLVGQGARVLIERGAALAGARFSDARLAQLTEAFIQFYRADIARESLPFAGAREALQALREGGATLSVCTNKRTDLSVALLRELDLERWFSAIVGADSVAHRKPHPDHYTEAVARAGGVLARSMMVGDSIADVGAAKAAGAPVAVVAFGYADEDPMSLGADRVLAAYAELPPLAQRWLAAPGR